MIPRTVYLGLGSNLGDREVCLRNALAALESRGVVSCPVVSGIWESRARYRTDQPDFLNLVARGETLLPPRELLAATSGIELELGRNRASAGPKGPRTIDIDILLYGDDIITEPDLVIPHPGIIDRKFVLLPLMEICPELADPVSGLAYSEALAALPPQGIYPWDRRGYYAPYP